MRNTCSRFHPPEYDPRANEQFYESMAQKGWLLETRDVYWSTFRQAPPQAIRYRAEYCGLYDLPEEQVALYEECGWTLVTRQRNLFLFARADDGGFDELYNDPAQQADSVRGLNTKTGPFLSVITVQMLTSIPFILAMLFLALFSTPSLWRAALPIGCGLSLLMVFVILLNARYAVGYRRLYRSLAAGKTPPPGSAARYHLWRIVLAAVFLGSVALLIIGIVAAFSLVA